MVENLPAEITAGTMNGLTNTSSAEATSWSRSAYPTMSSHPSPSCSLRRRRSWRRSRTPVITPPGAQASGDVPPVVDGWPTALHRRMAAELVVVEA